MKQRSLLKACTRATLEAADEIMEAPDSRAAPVKLCTRCSKLSRDFAGLDGALVPLVDGPLPKLNDNSGPPDGAAALAPGAV